MFERAEAPKLMEEVDRYLAAVDLFRAAGCEPTWRPERAPELSLPIAPSTSVRAPSDIELH